MKIMESPTLAQNRLAHERQKRGESVFNFSAGDPILTNHPLLLETATRFVEKGLFPYPHPQGDEELLELCVEWMAHLHGASFSTKNILITNGGKAALWMALLSVVGLGEEVLLPTPYWVSYPALISLCGGQTHLLSTREQDQWKLTPDQLKKAASSRTKVLILNNAQNPTGTLYSREELLALLQEAKRQNLWVISDEVYSDLVYEAEVAPFVSCASFEEHKDHVIVIQSFSKNFAMTGWRIGFVAAPEALLKQMTLFQGQTLTGVTLLSQEVAKTALKEASIITPYVRESMRERRDVMCDRLSDLCQSTILAPASSLYFFVPKTVLKAREGETSSDLSLRLLRESGVATVAGEAFGVEGFLRFSFSPTKETIELAFDQLQRLL